MNHIINLINSHHNAIFNLTIETIRSVPAWIALVITFILPNKTKKLDIEKMHKQFIFEEKYKIKLYDENGNETSLRHDDGLLYERDINEGDLVTMDGQHQLWKL